MIPAPSYRTHTEAASTPLQCPHCKGELFTPLPHQAVSLTRCPRPPCHRVMFVCTPEATYDESWPRRDATAMTLDSLLEPPRARGSVGFAIFVLLLFVAAPGWTILQATALQHPLAFACIVLTQLPALILGASGTYLCAVEALEQRRRYSRVRSLRQASLSRMDLLPAALRAAPEHAHGRAIVASLPV